MTENASIEVITKVLKKYELMQDPNRHVVDYDELLKSAVEKEEGWYLYDDNGKLILFSEKGLGTQSYHDFVFELTCRFNGRQIHPSRRVGFCA